MIRDTPKHEKNFYSNPNKVRFNEENKKIVSVPFSKCFSNLDKVFRDSSFKVVYKYPNTLGRKLISNRPKKHINSGVYKVPCKECNKVYYGETGRSFDLRLKEHKRDVINCKESNAIFVHKIEHNHAIDWEGANLLYKSNNYFTRRIIESSLIGTHPNYNLSSGNFKFDKVFQSAILRSTGLLGVT